MPAAAQQQHSSSTAAAAAVLEVPGIQCGEPARPIRICGCASAALIVGWRRFVSRPCGDGGASDSLRGLRVCLRRPSSCATGNAEDAVSSSSRGFDRTCQPQWNRLTHWLVARQKVHPKVAVSLGRQKPKPESTLFQTPERRKRVAKGKAASTG